jgi:hypothetical protein
VTSRPGQRLEDAVYEADSAMFNWYGIGEGSELREAVGAMLPWEYRRARESYSAAVGSEPPPEVEPATGDA